MLTKIAPQFWRVLYKWTPQEAKLLHGLKNLFQALLNNTLLSLLQDCMYLHELGEEAASFTKEEMQQG
jgi:hypothetical protein